MRIAILKDGQDGETRVAASPDTVKKFIKAGHTIALERGAGDAADMADSVFEAEGAETGTLTQVLKGTDAVFAVQCPPEATLKKMAPGTLLVSHMAPHGNLERAQQLADAGIDGLAMEFVPRITRAQSMDALSSQSNLAGYRAVIEASQLYGRAFPMMMTAAGTVAAAKAFVMGAGVAGLQAIATARRLGAIVSATDVRPAAKEQVASLGGKFIAVEDEEFKQAETAGGYAKQMSAEYQAKQAELVASHIAKQDVVVTTALIPGRDAPTLITQAMVETMKPGSVIVDIAAPAGGNCELTQAGKVVEHKGVKIAGFTNLPGRMAADASALYAKNLANLLPLLIDEAGNKAPHWDDEVIQGMALTRDGQVIHPTLVSENA
ncbi:Re/Si-specific NAD(P)(+) transhydrogenase subunit alpha [Maricaulis sp. D1M11]|uniref:Re/Si-specific NAD(P)(+) transhydrogenase subunit alpha n=1 Tax=Maricaulis sp. D1M11 TaxID=3076117 RepID=UPI0039B3A02E